MAQGHHQEESIRIVNNGIVVSPERSLFDEANVYLDCYLLERYGDDNLNNGRQSLSKCVEILSRALLLEGLSLEYEGLGGRRKLPPPEEVLMFDPTKLIELFLDLDNAYFPSEFKVTGYSGHQYHSLH